MGMSANPSAPTEVTRGLQRPGRSGPLVLGYPSRRRPADSPPSARRPSGVGAVAELVDVPGDVQNGLR